MTDTAFTPPGKGEWTSLRDHFPRALTPEYARLLTDGMREGEAIPMAEYGMPVKSLLVGLVHGHVYITVEPLLGKPANSMPPRAVLWAASRLVPLFRRRTRAARSVLVNRPWLADAEQWYATERGVWIAASRQLEAEDVDALGDPGLVDHLRRARAHASAGYCRHFALHGPDLIPTGLLLARCDDWGVAPSDVLPVLAGASPASLGQGPQLDALRAAAASAATTPETMDELRSVAAVELDAFLADFGWRTVTGYDLDSLTLGELPSLVVQLARPALAPRVSEAHADADSAVARLRSLVPSADHAELEQLVQDARLTFGVRDDNGALTGAWPIGLLRRAMLAAGRRLVDGGRLRDAHHALEVDVDELVLLLEGARSPAADEVAVRAKQRADRSELVPPPTLGPQMAVPVDALPGPMRTVSRAQLSLRDAFVALVGARAGLDGDGIGTEVYCGRALVAADPADALMRLEPGDVLVAYGTTPAYNMALSIAGAVVVEEGGLLSHAAVIARELGLPAVIGAAGCMSEIADGALVEVDPVRGSVRVLSSSAWIES